MSIKLKLIISAFLAVSIMSCKATSDVNIMQVIDTSLDKATVMSLNMAKSLEPDSLLLPRSFKDNKLITSTSKWWCSGFFPGTLWYLYENKPTEELKKYAQQYTDRVKNEQFTTDNHDVGFMIFCSFGNGLRITGEKNYENVIIQAAKSLSTRYNEKIGLIRSWDSHRKTWQYPVIIDNMMNLELLMWVAKNSENKYLETIARNHADKTMREHFRSDYSCYHLVDYDTISGNARLKQTVQGYADNSSWARGQAWGLYGYTMMYRETNDPAYLCEAEHIARFLLTNPALPNDKIPYWDYNAPDIPKSKRDASSAAIMASALVELSQLTKDEELSNFALKTVETQIRTLSSPEYFAEMGSNGNFILKHSVGFMSENSEVDVPLTYADYYYVEAMMRFKKLYNQINKL